MTEGVELKVVVPENNSKDDLKIITEDNIIDTILKLMEKVEDFIDMNGRQKKNYVLENLKSLIGADSFERYKYFISSFIDFAVSVSKGKKINLNKTRTKKKYCCF